MVSVAVPVVSAVSAVSAFSSVEADVSDEGAEVSADPPHPISKDAVIAAVRSALCLS